MTDLLPIIFARGQSEGIDPRVAPPDVHVVAKNVRWRKDGRPGKRYGIAQISNTGLNGGGRTYTGNMVNAIGSWLEAPAFVLGGGVRQLSGATWSDAATASLSEISHWSPGRHDPIGRADLPRYQNASVGYCAGLLLYAWDDANSVIFTVKTLSGVVLTNAATLTAGRFVRCISTTSFIYLLYENAGSLFTTTFDPSAIAFGSTVNVGALVGGAAGAYDGQGRGSDFVIVYQSAVATLTVKLLSAIAVPTTTQTQTVAMTAAQASKPAIASSSTSAVFVAWVEGTSGKVEYAAFNNGLTAVAIGPTNVNTSANNVDQPGVVIDNNTSAGIFWSGYDGATAPKSFMGTADITSGGIVTAIKNYDYCRLASKPFAIASHGTSTNDRYVWVHTHNSDSSNSGKAWDDQRTFYLLRTRQANVGDDARRQMHTPGMVGSTDAFTSHLSEVVDTGSGFFCALTNTIRFGNSATELYGIDSVSMHHIFESQRYAARDIAQTGRALQVGGGSLYEFTGYTEETDFTNAPVITGITSSVGGLLTPSSSYLYVAVFEWIDAEGRRHRSAPSDPFPFSTTAANFTAHVAIQTLICSSRRSTPSIHVYRTIAGGSTFHRVTPNYNPGMLAIGPANYTDTMSDANAAANEFVYTDGGVVPNGLCPPNEFMCVNNARLWVGGQLDRNVITASKILVDGEPTQFASPGDLQFSVFLPEDCTGLASIDGTVIAFAREAIYLITGDGPDDQGNGQFNPPQKLPSDTGCIDWRSVLETSIGVFYQSKRGFFLLPRGFNTPLFIGLEVEETVNTFPICLSATLVSIPGTPGNTPGTAGKLAEITARFVMTDAETPTRTGVCLVFDMRVMGWSVDQSPNNNPRLGPGGTWSDTFIQSKWNPPSFDSLWAETSSAFDDAGSFVTSTLTTGDIRPFGIAGYGGFESVVLLGEYRGNANVSIAVRVDGAAQDLYVFSVTSADAPDGSVYLDCTPKIRMGSSISVSVFDSEITPSEGFIPQALFIEHETIGKTKRLAAARRA